MDGSGWVGGRLKDSGADGGLTGCGQGGIGGAGGAEGRHDAETAPTQLINSAILETFIRRKVVAREGPNES